MKRKVHNNSGIILYIALWTMIILSMLAVAVGWQTHVELTLAKHFAGKIQSKYIALSGFNYSLALIKQDKNNKDIKKPDLFNPKQYSKDIKLGSGLFKITRLEDEESKININAITKDNYMILVNLLTLSGTDQESALTIACSVVDWIDTDKDPFNPPYSAEDEYYLGLGYTTKNKPFNSIEEIQLVRGMNKNIFQKLKDLITIYPFDGPLQINFDSAPQEVLQAFAQSFTGGTTNTDIEDASSLVRKILEYRNSLTDNTLSFEERAVEANKISLNSKERAIFLSMQSGRQRNPKYIHIHVEGSDQITNAVSNIDATISIDDLSIKRWQRI